MERLLLRLTPNWLKKLDHKLLIHDPVLWATRIHHVLYWGMLALLLAAFYGFYVPLDGSTMLIWGGGTLLLSVISLAGFLLWWVALLRYPAWETAGRFKGWLSWRNLLVFLLGTVLLSLVPMTYLEIVVHRANLSASQVWQSTEYGPASALNLAYPYAWKSYLLVAVPLLWLLTDIATYIRPKQFVYTLLSALGLGSMIFFVLEALGPGRDTALPLFIVLALVGQVRLLVEWVFEDNPAKEGGIWMQIVFLGLSTLHIWIIPTAIIEAIQMHISIESQALLMAGQRFAWMLGLLMALLTWQFYFRNKVLALQLQPRD